MRKTLLVLSFTVVALVGCSKELDEGRAKKLIAEDLSNKSYMVNVGLITDPAIKGPTAMDFANNKIPFPAGSPMDILVSTMKQLMDKHLVIATSEVVQFPKLEGRFTGVSGNYWDITTVPGLNAFAADGVREGVGRTHATGTIDRQDNVVFNYDQRLVDSYHYQENGERATMTPIRLAYSTTGNLEGKASGQTISVPYYTYNLRPDLEKQVVPYEFVGSMRAASPAVPGGECEVGEVSNLQLVTDTLAKATFTWHIKTNDIGSILIGISERFPKGDDAEAQFAKKPDGSWILVTPYSFKGYYLTALARCVKKAE